MPQIGSLKTWSDGDTVTASDLNSVGSDIKTAVNTYGVFKDQANTITETVTLTPASGNAVTVTTGTSALQAVTATTVNTTGAVTIAAGGVQATGNSAVTGDLAVSGALTKGGVAVVGGTGTSGRQARFTGTGTLANGAASDDGTFITNATQPCLRAASSGPASIASSSSGNFEWSSPPLNVGTMWAGANADRITVPANAGGTYLVTATVRLPQNATTSANAFTVSINTSAGSTTGNSVAHSLLGGMNSNDLSLTLTAIFQAAAGDYFTVQVTNNSGSTLSSPSAIVSAVKLW